jgi:lipoprotein-releasing system permease protein
LTLLYKLHLILKYLRKRRIAWVSLIAVMLCTAMVLVVISVMGGWLRMFRQTNHGLVGDLVVDRRGLDGFAHYEELIDDLQKLPEVKAAAPEVHTGGVINFANEIHDLVQIVGYDINRIGQVNDFVKSLYLQPDVLRKKAEQFEKDGLAEDAQAMRAKAATFPSWDKILSPDTYRSQLPNSRTDVSQWTGMIVGSNLLLDRNDKGQFDRPEVLYRGWVHLTVVPSVQNAEAGMGGVTVIPGWIVDDSHTKVYLVDAHTVYLPFSVLQERLDMGAHTVIDKATGQQITIPARCNQVQISLNDGYDPHAVKGKIQAVVDALVQKYPYMSGYDPVTTQTWDEQQAEILKAVENEKGLLVILFAIISVVAIFLIFCIFFMIVVEKTRDIGIIKSVGATASGVAAIFLGYGLTIGIVGAGMGLLLAYLIIHNINELHHWLSVKFHITIWNAKTYVFDTIPNTMDRHDVIVIISVAILSSVLGALVPALRAARMNPVEALRWE